MPNTALAKVSQAKKLAKKQGAGARSIKVKKEHEDGNLVCQIQLVKGSKRNMSLFIGLQIQNCSLRDGKYVALT